MSIPIIAGATLACAAGAIHNEIHNKHMMNSANKKYDTDDLMDMLNLIEAHYFMMLNRIDWEKSYNPNLRSKLIKDFDSFKDELFKVLLNQNK